MIPTWKRDINTHNRVGKRLRSIRERYGLTQAYVAKVIGCSPAAVGLLEQGRFGSMELLEAVLWAYGLDMGDLQLERRTLESLERARRMREAKPVEKRFPKTGRKARADRGVTRRAASGG